MTYKDMTFCARTDCKHRDGCHRHLSEEMRQEAIQLGCFISWGYFVDCYESEEINEAMPNM